MTAQASAAWPALGTTAAVVVADAHALCAARAAVEAEVAAIDLACSRFRDDSELSRLNAAAGRRVVVSALLFEAVGVALRAAQLTTGAVDPTVGAALILAGYDRDFALGPRRGAPAARVRRAAGWQTVRVDHLRRSVTLPRGVRLDLGATAKALAADRAAGAAARACGASVLVNLGGDIATCGPPPKGGWRVRVSDDHRAPPGATGQPLTLRGGGLATSSTTVRRWGAGSHHIIDPRTGRPAVSRWRTVSVAAGDCVDANTASTAAIVRGDDAPAWLRERRLPARLVDHDGDVLTVAGWPEDRAA